MKSPFEVLTKDPVELKVYKAKSALMILIVEHKRDNNLTQKQIAKICGVTQPRISSIINARFDLLSIDGLMRIALKLGIKVGVSVSDDHERLIRA